jgi:hypothetical protein
MKQFSAFHPLILEHYIVDQKRKDMKYYYKIYQDKDSAKVSGRVTHV